MVKQKSASDLIFPLCCAVFSAPFGDEKEKETKRALSLTVAATVPASNRIPWLRCNKKKTVKGKSAARSDYRRWESNPHVIADNGF